MITKSIQGQLLAWLAANKPSASCLTIAAWIGFGIKTDPVVHPETPDALLECMELLTAVPELRRHVQRMKGASPAWARLVKQWDVIESTFFTEIGLEWPLSNLARQTGALLQQALAADLAPARGAHDKGVSI